MRFSIRWKLLSTYLLVLFLMGGTLFIYLDRTLERQLIDNLRDNLFREAELATLLLDTPAPEPATIRRIGERTASRVSLIAADGTVRADSELPEATLATLENHRNRPEVAAALTRGQGSAVRHSTTTGHDMLYAAVRLVPAAPQRGVLRLALPLETVAQAKTALRQSLAIAFVLSGLLAIGLSLLLIQAFTGMLLTLREGAERFGAGDFRRKIAVASNDEVGDLTAVMNTMAERLNLQMESLASERNRLGAILRGMGEGLLVVDRDGTVRLFNPPFCALFHLDDTALGQPLLAISRHPALHATFRKVLVSRSEETIEWSLDNDTTLLTHWVPLLDNGQLIGVVAVFHDISDLKRLEVIRRDFVANVSHELRTPVTVIRGYAETLGSGVIASDPVTATRFARTIQTHAERLTALINDLLTLSQLEAQGTALNLVPIDLDERLQRGCSLLGPKAEDKGITLRIDADQGVKVLADAQRLEQILVNLLDNAVKFTPSGGVVTIVSRPEGEMLRVTISDTGPGIPPQALPRIFERFYRVDAGRSRAEGGTGLGLAIVKHLVTLHGGRVEVTNRPEGGSTFSFTLRRAG